LYPLCAVPHREQVLRFIGAPEAPTLSETVTPQRQTMSEEMFFAPATSKARRIEVR
jgi:hypothetical protein